MFTTNTTSTTTISTDYTSPNVLKNSPDYTTIDPSNSAQRQDLLNRFSYEQQPLTLDSHTGRPLNPLKQTRANTGRGKLYYWGPNHAADAVILVRSKEDEVKVLVIKRGDTGDLALPGGMVDEGEGKDKLMTARREFGEEALGLIDINSNSSHTSSSSSRTTGEQLLDELFDRSKLILPVYSGYVNDPRNTDNAWMESFVVLRVLDLTVENDLKLYEKLNKLKKAGDDAKGVEWLNVEEKEKIEKLYASHKEIVYKAVEKAKESLNKKSR